MNVMKWGVILKDTCLLSDTVLVEEYDSEALARLLKGVPDRAGFVVVGLTPKDGEWWTEPINWDFKILLDSIPDWYKENREKYDEAFKEEVKSWWNEYVLVDKSGSVKAEMEAYAKLEGMTYLELCGRVYNAIPTLSRKEDIQESIDSYWHKWKEIQDMLK